MIPKVNITVAMVCRICGAIDPSHRTAIISVTVLTDEIFKGLMEIIVDDDVKEFIISEGIDYRLSTTCSGPALVPTLIKPPKESDLKIPVGEFVLYISDVQRNFVPRITMDMVYDPEKLFSCAALSSLRGLY